MAPRFESVREDPAAAGGGIVQHPLQCQDSTKLRKVSEISRMVAILELYSTIVGKYAETCPEGGGESAVPLPTRCRVPSWNRFAHLHHLRQIATARLEKAIIMDDTPRQLFQTSSNV